MPWKEVLPMEERVRFAIMVSAKAETFVDVCRKFGISRKTGYKWWRRYQRGGLEALGERSSRPVKSPLATSLGWCKRIVALKKKRPRWGPKKLRVKLRAIHKPERVPAASTIGRILGAAGLIQRARKRRPPGPVVVRGPLSPARQSNDVWALDYKGWFLLGNGQRCEPLTVSDLFSRFILCCAVCPDVSHDPARAVFEKLFEARGLPRKIRVDNGPPFGSSGAGGLSRLAVWWISLGIQVEYIAPGHPEQNGSHERMHRTLKAEAIQPASRSKSSQQKRFDLWVWEFNYERPHEALGQQTPASLYRKSERPFDGSIQKAIYRRGHQLRRVRSNGQIQWRAEKIFIGEAYVGQSLGVVPAKGGKHQVYFYSHLLGELAAKKEGGFKPVVLMRTPKKQ
jgi:putative transposase